MRTCGDCRLCCSVFPLPALGKPAGRWCALLGPGGCTVHGAGQPEVCRRYSCYWLDHEGLPEELRPDRIGLAATESGTVAAGGYRVPVLAASLAKPESELGPAARAAIEGFVADGMAVLLIHGPDMRVVYDRARYPAIGPEDIEAAFRHELGRDAEELRRLGAVEEGFQPPAIEATTRKGSSPAATADGSAASGGSLDRSSEQA